LIGKSNSQLKKEQERELKANKVEKLMKAVTVDRDKKPEEWASQYEVRKAEALQNMQSGPTRVGDRSSFDAGIQGRKSVQSFHFEIPSMAGSNEAKTLGASNSEEKVESEPALHEKPAPVALANAEPCVDDVKLMGPASARKRPPPPTEMLRRELREPNVFQAVAATNAAVEDQSVSETTATTPSGSDEEKDPRQMSFVELFRHVKRDAKRTSSDWQEEYASRKKAKDDVARRERESQVLADPCQISLSAPSGHPGVSQHPPTPASFSSPPPFGGPPPPNGFRAPPPHAGQHGGFSTHPPNASQRGGFSAPPPHAGQRGGFSAPPSNANVRQRMPGHHRFQRGSPSMANMSRPPPPMNRIPTPRLPSRANHAPYRASSGPMRPSGPGRGGQARPQFPHQMSRGRGFDASSRGGQYGGDQRGGGRGSGFDRGRGMDRGGPHGRGHFGRDQRGFASGRGGFRGQNRGFGGGRSAGRGLRGYY